MQNEPIFGEAATARWVPSAILGSEVSARFRPTLGKRLRTLGPPTYGCPDPGGGGPGKARQDRGRSIEHRIMTLADPTFDPLR